MKRIFFFLGLLTVFSTTIYSQETISFKGNSKAIVAIQGQMVSIEVDTAYVLSYTSGKVIKERRLELIRMRSINDSLETILVSNVGQLENLSVFIDSLKSQALVDSVSIASSFKMSIDKLNQLNNSLQLENSKLQEIQKQQETLISGQETEINALKKKTKGIWWNGVKDKLAVFAGGVLVGAVIVLLL